MVDDRWLAAGGILLTLGIGAAGSRVSASGSTLGRGYADRPEDERHGILSAYVRDHGYQACRRSLHGLLVSKREVPSVRKAVERDVVWLSRHRESLAAGIVTAEMVGG